MRLFIRIETAAGLFSGLSKMQTAESSSIPENCWGRICASPGDPRYTG